MWWVSGEPWRRWSEYGECSKSCGGGKRTRIRQRVGRSCPTKKECESQDCNTMPCPSEPGDHNVNIYMLIAAWQWYGLSIDLRVDNGPRPRVIIAGQQHYKATLRPF